MYLFNKVIEDFILPFLGHIDLARTRVSRRIANFINAHERFVVIDTAIRARLRAVDVTTLTVAQIACLPDDFRTNIAFKTPGGTQKYEFDRILAMHGEVDVARRFKPDRITAAIFMYHGHYLELYPGFDEDCDLARKIITALRIRDMTAARALNPRCDSLYIVDTLVLAHGFTLFHRMEDRYENAGYIAMFVNRAANQRHNPRIKKELTCTYGYAKKVYASDDIQAAFSPPNGLTAYFEFRGLDHLLIAAQHNNVSFIRAMMTEPIPEHLTGRDADLLRAIWQRMSA